MKSFVIFGEPTDRQTDGPTDLGIKAPSRSLKIASLKNGCKSKNNHMVTDEDPKHFDRNNDNNNTKNHLNGEILSIAFTYCNLHTVRKYVFKASLIPRIT